MKRMCPKTPNSLHIHKSAILCKNTFQFYPGCDRDIQKVNPWPISRRSWWYIIKSWWGFFWCSLWLLVRRRRYSESQPFHVPPNITSLSFFEEMSIMWKTVLFGNFPFVFEILEKHFAVMRYWDVFFYFLTWKTTKMSAVRHSVIDKLLPNSSSVLIAIRKYPSMQSIWICTVFLMFVDNVLSPFDKAVMPEENLGRNDTQCIKLIQEYP